MHLTLWILHSVIETSSCSKPKLLGVSNMNVLKHTITKTNQGLCVSQVQNVQAYVLEVGEVCAKWIEMKHDKHVHFMETYGDRTNWMWVGWYWMILDEIRPTTCVLPWFAMFCLCFRVSTVLRWPLRGLGYFLGKAPKRLAEEHRSGPGDCKRQCNECNREPKTIVLPLPLSIRSCSWPFTFHPFSYCRSWKMAERFGYRHVKMCEGSSPMYYGSVKSRCINSQHVVGDFAAWPVFGLCGRGCILGKRERGCGKWNCVCGQPLDDKTHVPTWKNSKSSNRVLEAEDHWKNGSEECELKMLEYTRSGKISKPKPINGPIAKQRNMLRLLQKMQQRCICCQWAHCTQHSIHV